MAQRRDRETEEEGRENREEEMGEMEMDRKSSSPKYTHYTQRVTLSHVLAFAPRLCDVLLDVEGQASVPRVGTKKKKKKKKGWTYSVRY